MTAHGLPSRCNERKVSESKGVIDGDLIEALLDLAPADVQKVCHVEAIGVEANARFLTAREVIDVLRHDAVHVLRTLMDGAAVHDIHPSKPALLAFTKVASNYAHITPTAPCVVSHHLPLQVVSALGGDMTQEEVVRKVEELARLH
jgi:hypothetical protein